MDNNIGMILNAEQFIRSLFKAYLEDRDFPLLISMLHKDITWFGTGAKEVCKNYKETISLLKMEKESSNGRFNIMDEWYETLVLSEGRCLVYGELDIIEDRLSIISMEVKPRFSMICTVDEGEMKLYHAHFSVQKKEHVTDEFTHKTIIKDYNIILEEKLQERTKLLKEKTIELERLTNNICGGVQVCKFDDEFTIEFISEGFTLLTGYTKKDLDNLFEGKHLSIVYPLDIYVLKEELLNQLKADNYFSIEYRIIRKDGQVIWVLDNGMIIRGEHDEVKIQCILTDVTVKKKYEEALRLSEKRYEIALQSSGITMFEYSIVSGDLILFENDAQKYAVPTVIPNGVETFVKKGIIEPDSAADYLEMYRKIHNGAKAAKCYVKTKDKDNQIYDYELSLTTIFDNDGKPIRAIGVRTNISHMIGLQKEQDFGKNLVSNKVFIFEADMTSDKIEYLHNEWRNSGYTENSAFTMYLKNITKNYIFQEHQEEMLQKLSLGYIKKVLENGSSLFMFIYKLKNEIGKYIWYEATVNIIKDHITGHIRIRFYHMDIDERKLKEQRAIEEKQLYDAMTAKAILAYEMNITQNIAIKGHERWNQQYDISKSDNYSMLIDEFSKKGIHPDDSKAFYDTFQQEYILDMFAKGNRRIACQYRKLEQNGKYRWANCLLHLYEDIETNDVKGFSYVEDIDEQKRAELALKYDAEHDAMTGMLNKTVTEVRIDEYLKSSEGSQGYHAILVIDIDHFKLINDNFGHLFGDGVIKEIASKISSICRDHDIIGRIGGDEFCVFMKNISENGAAEKKAINICQKIKQTYSKDEKSCTISASIGIAIFNDQRYGYQELYGQADSALYTAKKRGRNQYIMAIN